MRLEGIPDAVYHATQGIGSSKLKAFSEAPAKFKYGIQKSTRSLDVGSAVHIKVLQPEIFDKRIACKPEYLRRNTNEFKAIAAANPGVTFLGQSDYNSVLECSDEVLQRYGQFFVGGTPEVSYWKRDERTGIVLKARIDNQLDAPLNVDLKTTVCAAPGEFERSAGRFGYYLQDALYSIVTDIDPFVFIAIETEASYLSTFNEYNESDRKSAKGYCRELINSLSLCYKKDEWPGYTASDEQTALSIPYVQRQKVENY